LFVSQAYVEEMRGVVNGSGGSVLDHSIESVLPGVHSKINGVHEEMEIKDAKDDIFKEIRTRDERWINALQSMTGMLQGGGGG
jgi:hypothetical protein